MSAPSRRHPARERLRDTVADCQACDYNCHSAAARLDAMFIDEGFGTLDPESLDQAVEALERLRDGERMVGIITHVPTLAERIPDGLSVEQKTGGTVVGVR